MTDETHFVDTNLFLRYITNDLPDQADATERLFRRAEAGELRLVISVMVIAEVVWVLESYYDFPRGAIKEAIKAIIATPGLDVEQDEILLQGVVWYAEKKVDFIDAYHVAWMLRNDLTTIETFDENHFNRFDHINVMVPR